MARSVRDDDARLLVQHRALGDPTRHAVFTYVRDASAPPTVSELTEHFGLNHNAIRQHLAKLREAGLVTEVPAAPTGPGRPPMGYRLAPGASDPWGDTLAYETLSLMLLDLLRAGGEPREVGRSAGRRLALAHGRDADAVEVLEVVARRLGFEPRVDRRRRGVDVVLGRCPFVSPAADAPDVVCELHRGVAEGIADACAGDARIRDLVVRPPKRAGCRIEVEVRPVA